MAKRYVFSYINFYDNTLSSEIVESDQDILYVAKERFGYKNGGEYEHDYEDTLEGLEAIRI